MKERHEEVEEDRREGEELQKLAVQFHIEKERLDNIKRDEKLQMMKDNMSQINDRQMIKKVMEQQEDVSVGVKGQCQLGGSAKGSDQRLSIIGERGCMIDLVVIGRGKGQGGSRSGSRRGGHGGSLSLLIFSTSQ